MGNNPHLTDNLSMASHHMVNNPQSMDNRNMDSNRHMVNHSMANSSMHNRNMGSSYMDMGSPSCSMSASGHALEL